MEKRQITRQELVAAAFKLGAARDDPAMVPPSHPVSLADEAHRTLRVPSK
jgi:hypothetical protein